MMGREGKVEWAVGQEVAEEWAVVLTWKASKKQNPMDRKRHKPWKNGLSLSCKKQTTFDVYSVTLALARGVPVLLLFVRT